MVELIPVECIGRDVCNTDGNKLQPGSSQFQCQPLGPDSPTMNVLCYLPELDRFNATQPPFVVMHGMKRDAQNYFDALMNTGEPQRLGVFLVVPNFSEELFPGKSGYNFGNIFNKNPEKWKKNHDG